MEKTQQLNVTMAGGIYNNAMQLLDKEEKS